MVRIKGAGLAGRVLRHELARVGIPSEMTDPSEFPRIKVCGGVLQQESWEYLKDNFSIRAHTRQIDRMSHFWRGNRIGGMRLLPPAVFISRFTLDAELETPGLPETGSLEMTVNATGAAQEGEWIGFQTREKAPMDELQMHYGRGLCLGISPTPENDSHIAFIIKRDRFGDRAGLKEYVRKESGVEISGDLKGTGRIFYGYVENEFAVGDAKMATFPFLGFGMKHAIDSARLLSVCLAEGDPCSYRVRHRRRFRRQRLASSIAGRLYDSPFQGALRPFVSNEGLIRSLYRWLYH